MKTKSLVPLFVLSCFWFVMGAEAAEKPIPKFHFAPPTETIGSCEVTAVLNDGLALDVVDATEIPMAPPEIDSRRCTTSERRICTDSCSTQQNTGVLNCTVGTVEGRMTLRCYCGDPGLYVINHEESDVCDTQS